MNYLVLDIETIPRADLTEGMEEAVKLKVQKKLEAADMEPADADSLIRSTSPFFGQVLCIGLRWCSSDSDQFKDFVVYEGDEEQTLRKFFEIINSPKSRNVRFVHYNGLGFDIPFLIIRAAHYGILIDNTRFKNLRRFTFDYHVDLMMFLASWSSYNAASLDVVCQSFGIPSPKEGEVKGNTVAQAHADGNDQAIREYVMRDIEATYQLFEKLKVYIT